MSAGRAAAPPSASAAAARAGSLLAPAAALLAGCFTFGLGGPPLGEPSLRPARQHSAQSQVVGNAVVASYQGLTVSLEPLSAEHLDLLYQNRPGIVNPVKNLAPGVPQPIAFRVIVRNRSRQAAQLEPVMFTLTDQEGLRTRPMHYQDFYQLFADMQDAEQRLRSVDATTLSSFVTVASGGEKDAFLYFPPMPESSRLLVLELGSLFLGAREVPFLAEFEVVRAKASAGGR
ncbi:MAG TPA: hypothetical protein VIG69_07410 [Candidatus Methylomirabilis sp.]